VFSVYIVSGVARIWCEEEGHETRRKKIRMTQKNVLRNSLNSDKIIGMCIFYWGGNHMESIVIVCAALKCDLKNQTVGSRGGARAPVPHSRRRQCTLYLYKFVSGIATIVGE